MVILDTAGRLHIDEELMTQLRQIDSKVSPDQAYLVVDGMTEVVRVPRSEIRAAPGLLGADRAP